MVDFEDAALEVISAIPLGATMSYGEVAADAGFPMAARAVGRLVRLTDRPIPWWRVTGAGGRIIHPEPATQTQRLINEGITVKNGRVQTPD